MPNSSTVQLNSKLESLKGEVFDEWLAAVRELMSSARKVASPILVDTLPMFYRRLAAIASHAGLPVERSTLAEEHGGERARLTDYDAQAVVHEFQIFRTVVLQVWARHNISMSISDMISINAAVDEAIRESVTGFVASEKRFREQFFAALAHDLRTPLSVASIAVDLIDQMQPPGKIAEFARMAQRQHAVLTKMIEDLLDTVAHNAGEGFALEFASAEMMAIVGAAVHDAQLVSNAEITLWGKEVHGHWSSVSIRRAIDNLLSNAIKYRAPHSTIHVSVEGFKGRVIVTVANSGETIPQDQQDSIFQMFKRVTAEQNAPVGWGIGLPFVRSVAERHGGSITVDSNAKSTRFVFDIPVDPTVVQLKT